MPKKDKPKWTAGAISALLRAKYAPPRHAFIGEVPNGTGWSKTRSCDGMAFGCWKSAGMHIEGFEIKVSRSDWLNELQQPEKSAAFEPYCHRWWIVAPSGVVKIEELPTSWGLMCPSGSGLRVKSASELRDDPKQMETSMIVALMRRAVNASASASERKQERDAGFSDGRSYGERSKQSEADRWKRRAENAEDAIREFHDASGLRLDRFQAGQIGQSVAALMRLTSQAGQNGLRMALNNSSQHARQIADDCDALLEQLTALDTDAVKEARA